MTLDRDRLKSAVPVLGVLWFAVCVLGAVVALRGDHHHRPKPVPVVAAKVPAEAKIQDRLPEPAVVVVDASPEAPVYSEPPELRPSVAEPERREVATEAENSNPAAATEEISPIPSGIRDFHGNSMPKRISPHRRHHVQSYQHEPTPIVDTSLLAQFFKAAARRAGMIP